MNLLLAAAIEYARLGWRVVPLHTPTDAGCSCGDPECGNIGKHPRIKSWQARATIDERIIQKWWRDWPDANVGIATGGGLLVLDRDHGTLPGEMPDGPVVRTGRGEHYYLEAPDDDLSNVAINTEAYDFDVRTDGGLVVAPPSKHASGTVYEWANPPRLPLPPSPEWLLELITVPDEPSQEEPSPNPTQGGAGGVSAYAQKAMADELDKIASAPKRNIQLNRSAFALGTLVGGGALDEESTFIALVDAAVAAGLTLGEARATARSGLAAGIQKPRQVAPAARPDSQASRPAGQSDEALHWRPADYIAESPAWLSAETTLEYLHEEEYGDAKLLATLYEGRLVYDHAEKQWYFWGGQSWQPDRTGLLRHLIAGQVARQYLHMAAELRPRAQTEERTEKLCEKLLARAGQLRRLSRCNNVREFATSLMGITGEEWDRDPWLMGVANGVLDLRTGKLRQGAPEDYIRVASQTVWRGLDWPAPRFERFISEIFDGDEEIAGFLQRLLGYGVTGLTVEHVFPVLWGEKGRNGKDTLLETLKRVLDDLADPVSTDVLLAPVGRGGAQPHLMDLMGKRLVWASETSAGARLNEAQVKLITGGGTIKTRPLYGSMVEFSPTHLVLLITNFKPKASAEDEALWNRMVLLPFNLRFVANPTAPDERQRDPHLVLKLAQERSGILAWLVRGCLAWQRGGLQIPEKIRASTQAYREEEDTIGQFLEECCFTGPVARVLAGDLYKAYKGWAEDGGMQPLNQTNFGKRIVKRFERKRFNSGFEYMGVGLLSQKGDRVIGSDPFSEKSDHESDRGKKFSEKGTQPITRSPTAPPPGQGEEGQPGEGSGGRVAVVGAKVNAGDRLWWRSKARELLREFGTVQELATNLDAFTVEKLQEFCAWLEARRVESPGGAIDDTRAAQVPLASD